MSWVLVVAVSLGSGVAASIVTTYGSQAKERKTARAEVAICLRRVEQIAGYPATAQDYHARLVTAIDELEIAMLVAALPSFLAAFYRDVRLLAYSTYFTEPPDQRMLPTSHSLAARRIAHQTALLLANVIWHPLLSAPFRRLRVRWLQRVLDGGMPDRARMRLTLRQSRREWERSLIDQPPPDGETPAQAG